MQSHIMIYTVNKQWCFSNLSINLFVQYRDHGYGFSHLLMWSSFGDKISTLNSHLGYLLTDWLQFNTQSRPQIWSPVAIWSPSVSLAISDSFFHKHHSSKIVSLKLKIYSLYQHFIPHAVRIFIIQFGHRASMTKKKEKMAIQALVCGLIILFEFRMVLLHQNASNPSIAPSASHVVLFSLNGLFYSLLLLAQKLWKDLEVAPRCHHSAIN